VAGPFLTRVLKPNDYGKDVQGVRRACRKFIGLDPPDASLSVQRKFNASMTVIVKAAQDEAVIPKSGWVGPQLMDALRRANAFDAYAKELLAQYAEENKLLPPPLGAIITGGQSVLLHDLTHRTDGFPRPGYNTYFPAFDEGFGRVGVAVLAPEPLEVIRQSSSQGGDAFYARGVSSIQYWFGHVQWAPPTGAHFRKGQMMTRIARIPASDGGPHVHCGINAKPLIGHELVHHTDYSHGAPTVGAQLKVWAAHGGGP